MSVYCSLSAGLFLSMDVGWEGPMMEKGGIPSHPLTIELFYCLMTIIATIVIIYI